LVEGYWPLTYWALDKTDAFSFITLFMSFITNFYFHIKTEKKNDKKNKLISGSNNNLNNFYSFLKSNKITRTRKLITLFLHFDNDFVLYFIYCNYIFCVTFFWIFSWSQFIFHYFFFLIIYNLFLLPWKSLLHHKSNKYIVVCCCYTNHIYGNFNLTFFFYILL